MAMIFSVLYPSGELATAVGYPDTLVVVMQVPRGPVACLFDELEIEAQPNAPGGAHRVVRVAAGPRRPTLRVRLSGASPDALAAWQDAREAEGWWTSASREDPQELWLVNPAERSGTWTPLSAAPLGDCSARFDDTGRDEAVLRLTALGATLVPSSHLL